MKSRPVLYVLAGVNGAGKSSIGGHHLAQAGLTWFNPDTYARELRAITACDQIHANAMAWQEGLRRLDAAIADRRNFAFETTLGGDTMTARIEAATCSHDVLVWFCGLASPEQHIDRVRARAAVGGHDIPENRIRERYVAAPAHLIALMPHLAHLAVYDNSVEVQIGEPIPDPVLVLEMVKGKVIWPVMPQELRRTPDWAKALVEAALSLRVR